MRHLLPAPANTSSRPTADVPPRRIRSSVATACNACRQHKTRCSGGRPACRRCAQRRIPCHYVSRPGETASQARSRNFRDLQDRATADGEFLELLRTLPDREAQDVLQRLRSGADVAAILNQVKAGNLLLQMAVTPETRLRYEFPYRSEMPFDCGPDNPYLDSLIYEAASLYSTDRVGPVHNLSQDGYQSLYLKPFHAARLMDPRLSAVRPSSWTAVCYDDVFMRDLGVFLRCEYQFTSAFQKDYFLEDMASHRAEFCSSLLVNVILAYSCVCYPPLKNRAEYWNPRTLTYRFFAEARRIWELEAAEPRITTIQAGILFNVLYNLCALDEIGQAYRIHAVSLAQRLRLFDMTVDGESTRQRNGKAFAAWALYSWETLIAFSFMHPPLLKNPPAWCLPDPAEDPRWYGELWVKYPLNHGLLPSYFGHVFKARCEFRVIMNDFCKASYSEGSRLTLCQANELRLRLRNWSDGLPGPLLPRTIVLPAHLQLHMYYHYLLLAIFEPLLGAMTSPEALAQQVVAESRNYLQTLVRLYYLRHGFEAMDLFIIVPLMLVGDDCIDDINEQTPAPQLEVLRSTLILVAKGLCDQRRNHYLAEALFRVIRRRMRPQEVALLRDTIRPGEDEAGEKRELMQAARSHWPVSVVRKKTDMGSPILSRLVESFAHLNTDHGP